MRSAMRYLLLAVMFALSCADLLAQQPTSCAQLASAGASASLSLGTRSGVHGAHPFSRPSGTQSNTQAGTSSYTASNTPSGPILHSGKPLAVDVLFERGYRGKATDEWPDGAKKDVCEAAHHLEEIWSSQEFQSALSQVPELILEADKEGRVLRRISGPDLLSELLSKPRILLAVALRSSWLLTMPQCAESDYLPGETLLQSRYLVDRKSRCGEPPLLPALTNTLGHEYMHYEAIGATDAGKFAEYNGKYVSYGVGCLTQNIGFPDHPCRYSPVQVASGVGLKR